ncbi:uncharacterized protein TNCT_291661 [Trichonephila clavata]|uniref:DUF7041 domain-containing protein n=1 Tax=Trichonephila clavata TaxID=2740835 RepID=A0A8X6EZJ0_TRICU|nr:uncharacterized protein TNCT_291661 [Trichonephila clavata]
MTESGEDISFVNRVAVKIPPVWKTNIPLWLKQYETAFSLARIINDETKFSHLIANIDLETLEHVSNIILNPPVADKYLTLKNRLISEFQDTETQQIKKLLSDLQLGDKKPSFLLRQIRELSLNKISENFFKNLWMQRLPVNVQAILSASTDNLSQLAHIADKAEPAFKHNVDDTIHIEKSDTETKPNLRKTRTGRRVHFPDYFVSSR